MPPLGLAPDTSSAWDLKQYDNDKFQLDGRKVDLDQSSGQDFGQWGSSSTQTIKHDYLAITRGPIASDEAGAIANAINAGTQTEAHYVTGLLSQVADTTIPAVAVEASMYGATGTSAEVTKLANEFLPAQVDFAKAHGFDPGSLRKRGARIGICIWQRTRQHIVRKQIWPFEHTTAELNGR